MLHLMGSALIFLGTCWVGWAAAREKKRKAENLREMAAAIRMMEREIGVRMTPLPELLCLASAQSNGSVGMFFKECAVFAKNNDGLFAEKWEKALRKLETEIEKESLECLVQLGKEISRYSWEEEKRLLSLTADNLEEDFQQATKESAKCGRLYRTLGAAAGAMLVILLV